MARKFPRFLFSNPKNTKSEGPFVIHTLEPRIIFKVVFDESLIDKGVNGEHSGFVGVVLLDNVEYTKKVSDIAIDAVIWTEGQIEEHTIDISKTAVMMQHFQKAGLQKKVTFIENGKEKPYPRKRKP